MAEPLVVPPRPLPMLLPVAGLKLGVVRRVVVAHGVLPVLPLEPPAVPPVPTVAPGTPTVGIILGALTPVREFVSTTAVAVVVGLLGAI